MGRVVVDGLAGHLEPGILAEGVAGVGVAVIHGEVTAGDLEPDLVTRLEQVAGRPDLDGVAVDPAGPDEGGVSVRDPVPGPLDPVVEVDRSTVRIDIDELGGEIGVP